MTAEDWLREIERRSLRQDPRNCLTILTSNLARLEAKRLDPVHGIRNLYLNKAPA